VDSLEVMHKAGRVSATAHTPEQIAIADQYRHLAVKWCAKRTRYDLEALRQVGIVYDQGRKGLSLDRSKL